MRGSPWKLVTTQGTRQANLGQSSSPYGGNRSSRWRKHHAPTTFDLKESGRHTVKEQSSSGPPPQGRRPHSAPVSGLRIKSAGKLPIFLRQPQTIRVISYKNGTRQTSAKVTASDITTLLEECTSKLKLNSAARRIFLSDGIEVFLAEDLAIDSEVFVSMGEAFLEPQREIRVVLDAGGGGASYGPGAGSHQGQPLSPDEEPMPGHAHPEGPVFRNGTGSKGCEVSSATDHLEQFLDLCTSKLHLTSVAKLVYDWDGRRVEDISQGGRQRAWGCLLPLGPSWPWYPGCCEGGQAGENRDAAGTFCPVAVPALRATMM
ncbi:hypothetical protein J4Q44_G00090450 [Coregonus suidteri]|uniref:DCDC1 second doublecortin-like domain-containing protein n=1 Tax=Coregonus suidteri TaxID=861788 RepID=A0AAN8R209_9TELE